MRIAGKKIEPETIKKEGERERGRDMDRGRGKGTGIWTGREGREKEETV